jgi:hypothetical protein
MNLTRWAMAAAPLPGGFLRIPARRPSVGSAAPPSARPGGLVP